MVSTDSLPSPQPRISVAFTHASHSVLSLTLPVKFYYANVYVNVTHNGGVEEKAGKETDLNARGYYFFKLKVKRRTKKQGL